jgi:hypothetical protein
VQKGLKLPATPSKNDQEQYFASYVQVSRNPAFAFVVLSGNLSCKPMLNASLYPFNDLSPLMSYCVIILCCYSTKYATSSHQSNELIFSCSDHSFQPRYRPPKLGLQGVNINQSLSRTIPKLQIPAVPPAAAQSYRQSFRASRKYSSHSAHASEFTESIRRHSRNSPYPLCPYLYFVNDYRVSHSTQNKSFVAEILLSQSRTSSAPSSGDHLRYRTVLGLLCCVAVSGNVERDASGEAEAGGEPDLDASREETEVREDSRYFDG